MRKREMILLWLMSTIIIVELMVLLFLVYFSTMPFFLFIFVSAIKLLSFFLIGFIALFLVLTIIGKKPADLIASWFQALRESLKFFWTSIILTFTTLIVCTAVGFSIVYCLKRFYYLPDMQFIMRTVQQWVSQRIR